MLAASLLIAVVMAEGTVVPSPSSPPPPAPLPVEAIPPAPPPVPEPAAPPRYGDRGTSDLALGVGYSSNVGFAGGAGFRYFVFDRVAPGIEGAYFSGGAVGPAFGFALANLRVVPVRADGFALVLTGRAGRAFLSDHRDGWAVGGSAGVVIAVGPRLGLEVGWEALQLVPQSVCADLARCLTHGPVLGLRLFF